MCYICIYIYIYNIYIYIPLEIPRVHLGPGFVALKVSGPGSPMLQTLWFQPPVATRSRVWSPGACYKMLGSGVWTSLQLLKNLHVQHHQNVVVILTGIYIYMVLPLDASFCEGHISYSSYPNILCFFGVVFCISLCGQSSIEGRKKHVQIPSHPAWFARKLLWLQVEIS